LISSNEVGTSASPPKLSVKADVVDWQPWARLRVSHSAWAKSGHSRTATEVAAQATPPAKKDDCGKRPTVDLRTSLRFVWFQYKTTQSAGDARLVISNETAKYS
jgi:hypothetical protein